VKIFTNIKEKTSLMSKIYIYKGDDPMNKVDLFKKLRNASQGNFFSTDIPKASLEDEKKIEEWIGELENEGKIKLREYVKREDSIYLHGIIKYASE
jgi:hypothetical protein